MSLAIGSAAAPWGPIWIAANDVGVVAMEQLVSAEEFAAALGRRFGAAATQTAPDAAGNTVAAANLSRAMAAVRAFVEGDLDAFDGLPLDLGDRPVWDRSVFLAVRELGPGTTASYGDVARMIGRPGAARAVGGAIGRCPIGLAIPCHRVIAADGTLGGYGGGAWGGRQAGLELKRQLLSREGVFIDR